MDNPFLRRATEFLRDEEAFLAIVSPEPVTFFLRRPAQAGTLYDRLVLIRGTPGSGKTTLARLFEFPTLTALLRNSTIPTYKDLTAALTECGAIVDDRVALLGCRLPLETDYRDFWEFPYPESLKLGLMGALIQARSVLAWFRHLSSTGIDLSHVSIVPRPGAEAFVDAIGGTRGADVAARARIVENALYRIMGALIAPSESQLDPGATEAYRPFDIIDRFSVSDGTNRAYDLRPLAILDDAHVLHPGQFRALERWLARRELRIGRWMIARFDILLPQEVLRAVTEDKDSAADYPGLKAEREIETVLLQSSGARRQERKAFRRMAKDMAQRYLRRMPLLSTRNLVSLGDLLGNEVEPVSASKSKELQRNVDATQRRLQISEVRRQGFEQDIAGLQIGGRHVPPDLALAMLLVLMHRYDKRRRQPTLFTENEHLEPSRPVVVNQSVHEAACLHLLHRFDRPYYYGIDDLCDASSENAEQFLQLAAVLVETIATQVIRSKSPLLDPITQHTLLRQRGERIIDAWNFPHHQLVHRLVSGIATRCVDVTQEPNGWLTPNAFGVEQEHFASLSESHSDLARVLQFAVSYNAVTLVPHYPCKDKEWCLIELGGMVILKHGLTLKRGGFVEGTLEMLAGMLHEANR